MKLIIPIIILSSVLLFNTSAQSQDIESRVKYLERRMNELEMYMETFNINYTHQKITVTAYHPNSKGINSDKNPSRTATMKRPIPGYTLAISTELFNLGWLNKKIYINGWGVGKATDRMGASIEGRHIDICFPSLKAAKKFGVKRDVLAVLLQ